MRPRGRRALLATPGTLLALWTLCMCPAVASAQSSWSPEGGLGWDLELDGGVGFGLQRQLDNNFVGRLRLGALYFDEPIVYALGITGEVGGLAEYGVGAAFEVSHFDGPWARIGGSRVIGNDWMTQLTLGFLFFGLEWQHRFESASTASDALMMVFRLPVGVWWFMMAEQRPMHGPLPSLPEPTSEPSPAEAAAVAPQDEEVVAPHAVLRLRVEPLAADETVWLDGQRLTIDALGYPMPIAPGAHVIVVKREESIVLRMEVSAEAGGNVSLKLDPTQPTAAAIDASQTNEGGRVDVGTGTGDGAR